jgi:hypothetical protein
MPFGKYNNNENFWRGFSLPHSQALEGLHAYDVLSHFRKRYGDDKGNISSEGKDILLGLAASLSLQGFSNAAKFLYRESGIQVDARTERRLNLALYGGQMRLEEGIQPREEVESFTDSFIKKLKA